MQLPNLISIDPVHYCSTDYLLDNAENHFGITFPPSYRSFAKKYGFGLTGGLFIIYIPVDTNNTVWCSDLADHSNVLAQELDVAVTEGIVSYKPDGSKDLVTRLIPFGSSENGHIIAWHPVQRSKDGEMAVYIIGSRKYGVYKAGDSFAAFLHNILKPNLGGVMGNATFQLSPTFEPWRTHEKKEDSDKNT